MYECFTCGIQGSNYLCVVCVKPATRAKLVGASVNSFCSCGAGLNDNGEEQCCRALDEAVDENERFFPPRIACTTDGAFVFLLSSDHGLMRLGTGKGSTATGKIYVQNMQM